jgi:hypothetical protein
MAVAQALCASVAKKSGKEIAVTGETANFHSGSPTLGFKNDTILQCLDELIASYNQNAQIPISFWFAIDPDHHFAALNLYQLRAPRLSATTQSLYLTVENDRPLATAAAVLANETALPVVFEDALYQCDCAFFKDRAGERSALVGNLLDLRFDGELGGAKMLELTVDEFNRIDRTAQFGVSEDSNGIYIFPTAVRDTGGKLDSVQHTILSQNVNLTVSNMPLSKLDSLICDQISRGCAIKVAPDDVPAEIADSTLSLIEKSKPASNVFINGRYPFDPQAGYGTATF